MALIMSLFTHGFVPGMLACVCVCVCRNACVCVCVCVQDNLHTRVPGFGAGLLAIRSQLVLCKRRFYYA